MDKYTYWLIVFFSGIMFLPFGLFFNIAYYGVRGNFIELLHRSDFVYYGLPVIGIILIISSSLLVIRKNNTTVCLECNYG